MSLIKSIQPTRSLPLVTIRLNGGALCTEFNYQTKRLHLHQIVKGEIIYLESSGNMSQTCLVPV